jgi:V/A-type H+-transporting ATPase subunit E
MNQENQIKALEKAILDRAHGLADELYAKASNQRDSILRNTSERLHLTEQREVLAAKAIAERTMRRQVQAGELKLQGRLETLRWQLVLEVEQRLQEQMLRFRADQPAYFQWLADMIHEAVMLIPAEPLVAEVNADDLAWLNDRWADISELAAPGRELQLSPVPLNTCGGVRVTTLDNRIRLDNRFEGRLARLGHSIRRTIQQQLFQQSRPT